MCDDLSFVNTTQKTLKCSKAMFQLPGWMRKTPYLEISAEGYWQKHEMQVASKRFSGKATECSKHLQHIAIEGDIFQNLADTFFKYL